MDLFTIFGLFYIYIETFLLRLLHVSKLFIYFFNFIFFESCMSMCDKLLRMACWLSEWT